MFVEWFNKMMNELIMGTSIAFKGQKSKAVHETGFRNNAVC